MIIAQILLANYCTTIVTNYENLNSYILQSYNTIITSLTTEQSDFGFDIYHRVNKTNIHKLCKCSCGF